MQPLFVVATASALGIAHVLGQVHAPMIPSGPQAKSSDNTAASVQNKPQVKVEIGELNGAPFRIDVPEKWSSGLVMYCHGFNNSRVRFDASKPLQAVLQVFLERGFAVAQSGYSEAGWALAEAIHDTEALRRYFAKKYGAPGEAYVTGHSSGGLLAIALVELFPDAYEGGLALCGVNGPVIWLIERRDFDHLVVFDYYFPGVLPPLDKVPADYRLGYDRIAQLLKDHPEKAESLRKFSGLRNNQHLGQALSFFTISLADMQRRAGGNPIDNRNTIYFGTSDDNAVNDGVKRYAADGKAAEYLKRYYTPTGALKRPILAIQTTYDPLVPGWLTNAYVTLTQQAGAPDLFVQQYVKRDGHCTITPNESGQGFDQLRQWRKTGAKPPVGAVK